MINMNARDRESLSELGSSIAALGGVGETSGAAVMDPVQPAEKSQKTVIVCDTQPVTAEGIRTVLAGNPDLHFHQVADTLGSALELAHRLRPDVMVVDKAFGIQAILEWLNEIRQAALGVSVVVWGVSVAEAAALDRKSVVEGTR